MLCGQSRAVPEKYSNWSVCCKVQLMNEPMAIHPLWVPCVSNLGSGRVQTESKAYLLRSFPAGCFSGARGAYWLS